MSSNVNGPNGSPRRGVYLISTERSGSNLLRSILNTHSEIAAPHPIETGYPWQYTNSPENFSRPKRRRLVRDILLNKDYSFHPLTVQLDVRRIHDLLEKCDEKSFLGIQNAIYSETLRQRDASFWVSKYPRLWSWIDEAASFYDEFQVIYLVRDPRDVVLSFKTSKVGDYHPYFNAQRWRDDQIHGIELLDELENIHLIRYEDLLSDSEEEVKDVCSFLDIEYEPEMLRFYQTDDAKAVAKSSDVFKNVSSPIDESNSGKFKNQLPEKEVKITEKVVHEQMNYFDYEPMADVAELESLDIPESKIKEMNEQQFKEGTRHQWRQNPGEEIKSFLSGSFTRYMILRYGILS